MAERFDLLEYAYAHRGFWAKDGPPENSLEAFSAAAKAGLGIELDVRPAADGTPICFHDPFLDRMASASGLVCEKDVSELRACKLPNGEPLPLFSDVLDMWPQHLPILVELKIDGLTDAGTFAGAVAEMVSAFSGKAAMMSFHENAVAAIPPGLMRGQLIGPSSMMEAADYTERIARARSSSADYLALHISDATAAASQALPVVCWTVTQQIQREMLKELGFAEIFEHLPAPLAAR